MDEEFLQFLILKEGTLVYGQKRLYFLDHLDIENYFKKEARTSLPNQVKLATALSIVLIFILHIDDCHDFIVANLSPSINFGKLLHKCLRYLQQQKLLSAEHLFLLPSIIKPIKTYKESFQKWNTSLMELDIDFTVSSNTIKETINALYLFISFVTNLDNKML